MLRASNGPMTVEGSRGKFDVETSSGPIGIRLTGRRSAVNGPVTVNER